MALRPISDETSICGWTAPDRARMRTDQSRTRAALAADEAPAALAQAMFASTPGARGPALEKTRAEGPLLAAEWPGRRSRRDLGHAGGLPLYSRIPPILPLPPWTCGGTATRRGAAPGPGWVRSPWLDDAGSGASANHLSSVGGEQDCRHCGTALLVTTNANVLTSSTMKRRPTAPARGVAAAQALLAGGGATLLFRAWVAGARSA